MSTDVTLLLTALGRTTLWLAGAGLIAAAALRLTRTTWPAAHRAACLLTLLVGWTFLQLPLEVPWYDAPREHVVVEAEPTAPPLPAIPPAEPLEAQAPLELTSLEPAEPAVAPPAPIEPPHVVEIRKSAAEFNGQLSLLIVWLAGIVLLPVAWLVGYVRFVRSIRSRVAADEPYQAEWRGLLADESVQAAIPLRVTDGCGPMLCRLPRGYELIVPARLWRELDVAGRAAILRHELAHYRRGDVWKSLAVRLLALPHWFNPVGWWAVRRFDEAAEWACDRAAAADDSATEYAKVLVRLGEGSTPTAYGSAARGRVLAGRVRRVLAGTTREDSTMKKSILIAAGLLLVTLSLLQIQLVAREPQEDDPPQPADGGKASAEKQPESAEAPKADEEQRGNSSDPRPPASSRERAKQMLEMAEKAFHATRAAWESEQAFATVQTFYELSLRWMQAAERVAESPKDKLAAVRDHMLRMRQLEHKTKLLYEVGAKGGEDQQYYSASYYLADAERLYAEAEAAVALGRDPAIRPLAADVRMAAESQVIDLKVAIAKLQYEIEQAKSQLEPDIAKPAGEKDKSEQSQAELQRQTKFRAEVEAKLKAHEARLKLYQDKLKTLATLDTSQTPATPAAVAGAQTSPAALSAAKRMVDEAKKTYDAALAAFNAETTTIEPVLDASLRWMRAADRLAESPAEKLKIAKEHFDRMHSLEEKAKKLYDVGLKGGEAQMFHTASFYAAEAERMLAEAEGAVALGKEPNTVPPSQAGNPALEEQAIDLKIKIAELRGQMEQAKVQADATLKMMRQESATTPERQRLEAEHSRFKVQLKSYDEQLKLHEDKLKLMTSPRVAWAIFGSDDARSSKPAAPPTPGERQLLYDGKNFDGWAEDLRTELSPTRRTEAINALAAFARHGKGTQAATEILRAMRGYPITPDERTPDGLMMVAAFNALQAIPMKELTRVVHQGLKSDDVEERYLAAYLLNSFAPPNSDNTEQLKGLLKDSYPRIRVLAANRLVLCAAEIPAVVDVLREAMASTDPAVVGEAQSALSRLVNTLADSSAYSKRASESLKALGPLGVPTLEQFLKTESLPATVFSDVDPKTVKQHARELLEELRKQQAEQTPK